MVKDPYHAIRKQIHDRAIADGRATVDQMMLNARDAMAINERLLTDMLKRNSDTEFGRLHDFASIDGIEAYKRRVPIASHADYAPYINRMADGGEQNLLFAEPVVHFFQSSGTSGSAKRLPCTASSLDVADRYTSRLHYGVIANEMGDVWTDAGGMLAMAELEDKRTPAGFHYSNFSGRLINSLQRIARFVFCVPPEVMTPKPGMNRLYLYAMFSLADPRLSVFSCTFVPYMADFLRYIEDHWEKLAKDLEDGVLRLDDPLPDKELQALQRCLRPDPARAEQIRAAFRESDALRMTVLWPEAKCLITAAGGDLELCLEKLRPRLGDVSVLYYGIVASEGVFSAPYRLNDPSSMLLPDAAFFEFWPEGETDPLKTVTLDGLETGKRYEMIVTNLSGLYRYRMNDVVEITGRVENCPVLRFAGRSFQQVNMVGEKMPVTDVQVLVDKACESVGAEMIDFAVYCNMEARPLQRHEFYVETRRPADAERLRDLVDDMVAKAYDEVELMLNNGRIGHPTLQLLEPGTFERYKEEKAARVGRIPVGQIKNPHLLQTEEQVAFFRAHALR